MDSCQSVLVNRLDNVPQGSLVAVAMSGGVDSSVAAALVQEAGYQVVGITLQLYDQGIGAAKKKACCAGQDIYDARVVADQLGFLHYVLDYETMFKEQVIDDFIDSYLQGATPIPCIRCNQRVKFNDLLKTATQLGAAALVTGHYVKRLAGAKGPELHRALEYSRDQSYFLFATTTAQLDYLRFPLGAMNKQTVRAHAKRLGLLVAEKPDSQDICFVPEGNYPQVIEKFRPGSLEQGEIVHLDGRVLGTHQGIINFTIGQRRGLGISSLEPLFVIRLEASTRRVIVGPREALAQTKILVTEVNWLVPEEELAQGLEVAVKVRSSHNPAAAMVKPLSSTHQAEVTFAMPEYGVAAGQACVFYRGDRVLGGGWII